MFDQTWKCSLLIKMGELAKYQSKAKSKTKTVCGRIAFSSENAFQTSRAYLSVEAKRAWSRSISLKSFVPKTLASLPWRMRDIPPQPKIDGY